MNAARLKNYDYGVMGLFVLTLIGVSLSWYTVSVSLGGQSVGAGDSGWHYALGVLSFVAALAALIVVCLKVAIAPGGALPGWYKEGIFLMALGGLVALFAFIGFFDKPGGVGVDIGVLGLHIGYGAGIFLTLVAGLLVAGCGFLALGDRSAASAGAAQAPIAGPGGGAAQFCQGCGTRLEPGSRFCKSCGRPQ
jgi:hypothetical protein